MGALYDFAIDKDGNEVYIGDVKTGRECNCYCPYCKAPFIARNRYFEGRKKAPYFAHDRGCSICEGPDETAVHCITKEVIQECGGLLLPPNGPCGAPEGFVTLCDIKIEWSDNEYGFKPDVTGILPDGRRLYIECYVTHKVSTAYKKHKAIIDNNLLCVEIDMRHEAPNKDVIRKSILEDTDNRKWIVKTEIKQNDDINFSDRNPHPEVEKAIEVLMKAFDENKLAIVSAAQHDGQLPYHTLKYYHYNKCYKKTKFRRLSSDILLYCGDREDRHYISINFRFRGRREGFQVPSGLRMIDIYFGGRRSVSDILDMLERGVLSIGCGGMEFLGCWDYDNLKSFTIHDVKDNRYDLFNDL